MAAFEDTYGDRVAYSSLFDCLETFFREGGSKAYVARFLGPTPVIAKVDLSDSTPATTLRVSAKSAGEWGNSLNVQVIAGDSGSEFKLVISHDTLGLLEQSPSLADTTAAIAWATASSDWVNASELAGTGDPVVAAAASMTGGADDRTNVTDTQRTAALDQFTKDLGPGQVSIPGATSATVHEALLNHAADNNRVALLDAADSTSAATIASAATAIRALSSNLDRHGALFAPWATIVGLTGSATTRTVPYSAVEAGLIARSDAGGNPNVPAAGDNGIPRSVLDLTAVFTDTERETLNDAGVNVARLVYEVPKTYGFRTVADPDDAPLHWMLNNIRTDMAITAKAEVIAERYLFRIIDGRGLTTAHFGGELADMLNGYYEIDALYGLTADEAFRVDVGDTVNTVESIAEGRLRAILSIRRAPFAERVEVEIVKVAINDTV